MANYKVRNELRKILSETVEQTLSTDPYYYIAPYLYKGEIDKDCPFFKDNNITLPSKLLASEDLKTIAYLAKFYRNRLAYDPRNIDRYMWATGHIPYSKSSYDILCFETSPYLNIPIDMALSVHENIHIYAEVTL